MRRRTALLLAPLVALAACGGGAGDDDAGPVVDVAGAAISEPRADLLVRAVDATVAATTARVATEISAQPAVGEAISFTGEGFVDLVTGDLSVTAHLGDLAATFDPALAGWTDPQIVVIADFVFLRLPAPGAPDGTWVRFDTGDLADLAGGAFTADGVVPQTTDLLAALGDVAGEVVQGPTEELDGVTVTRYDATIPLDDLGAGLAGLPGLGATPLTADVSVWIDGDARVRRVETTATTAIVTIRASVAFSDFGVSFDPQPPPGWIAWDDAFVTTERFEPVGDAID